MSKGTVNTPSDSQIKGDVVRLFLSGRDNP